MALANLTTVDSLTPTLSASSPAVIKAASGILSSKKWATASCPDDSSGSFRMILSFIPSYIFITSSLLCTVNLDWNYYTPSPLKCLRTGGGY
jgi:hypothetical protein